MFQTLLNKIASLLRADANVLKEWRPQGHFYSPIPAIDEIREREDEIFSFPASLPGVDLNEQGQVDLFNQLTQFYDELPFTPVKGNLRYFFENPNFSYADAIILYCMLRQAAPKRIIEIGSGYSSCVTLDTNELFFANGINCTFIEPYTELLFSLLKPTDRDLITVVGSNLQDVDISIFSALDAGDILFIDSTHVSKVGSDVNHLLFKILPSLAAGVIIHFHDIFYPFEYPKEWVYEGRAWNEAYLLRAFLQYNPSFKVTFFNSYFAHTHYHLLQLKMPLCMKNTGGSIWLQKVN